MNWKVLALCTFVVAACSTSNQKPIVGTWKLISGTITENGQTTVTDYTQGKSFIKIINDTHFAFTLHDLNGDADTTKAFASGAGRYTLNGDNYTEHLEYCTDRQWEGHDFAFTIKISNDTLIQRGVEKIESQGIDRLNEEKYVRVR
ncbi:MAG TPA: lipocalin family protein [Cyclobacteriaceae bacterium]|nr:lipocalin family protein [Cyclobacteriaceae bacterium]